MSDSTVPQIGQPVHIPSDKKRLKFRTVPSRPYLAAGSDGSVWQIEGDGWTQVPSRAHTDGYIVHYDSRAKNSVLAHRLVLEAFRGKCPEGMECLHGNGVRNDNRICNLRWGTRAENVADALRHGTIRCGEQVSHLSNSEIETLRKDYADGATQLTLAKKYALSRRHVSRIVRGERWKSVGGPLATGRRKKKLDRRQADEIRSRYDAGESPFSICKDFDISPTTVYNIGKRETWRV